MYKIRYFITDELPGPNHCVLGSFSTIEECVSYINDKNLTNHHEYLHIWETDNVLPWPGISLTPLKEVIRILKIGRL